VGAGPAEDPFGQDHAPDLRKIATANTTAGDISTLADRGVVQHLMIRTRRCVA
jgi:hypothetical protein